MDIKSTDELLKQLNNCNNIDEYLKSNEEFILNTTIAEYLYNTFDEKCLKKSQVFRRAEIDEIYGYQIFGGRKNPSRDTLLAICIGGRFSLNEIQTALKIAGYAPLYAKSARDAIIIFGINKQLAVCEINEKLYNNSEKTLN